MRLAVGREPGATVVADAVGDLLQVAAIGVHRVQVDVPVHGAGEDQLLPIGRDGGLGVVGAVVRQLAQVGAVELRGVDLEVADGPDVALGLVGRNGAGLVVLEGAAVEDPLVAVVEEAAGGAALAVRHAAHVGAVGIDEVLLVAAGVDLFLPLEDQLLAVAREIRLGVVAAEGQLADVPQVTLTGVGLPVRGGGGRGRDGLRERPRLRTTCRCTP